MVRKGYDMEGRRKHPRASLQTEIWLGQDGIFTRTTETLRDLSEGGAFVETGQRFPVGSILNLRFKLLGTRDWMFRQCLDEALRIGVTGIAENLVSACALDDYTFMQNSHTVAQ